MLITNICIQKVHNANALIAVASITLDDIIAIHDIKIIYKNEKYFFSMPSKKVKEYYLDIAHPINSETRERIQKIILEKYEEALAEEPEEV